MRRLVAGLAVAAAALSIGAPWEVGAQEPVGVSVTAVGWWSSRPTAIAQPEGGFEVAAGPTGEAQSIAALRISIAGTKVDTLQMRLVEASSLGTELGGLRVCTTSGAWAPANPGAMADAPKPSCEVSTALTRTGDGLWLGDVAALAPSGGEVSLMIVPSYQSPVGIGPGMVVTISGGELTGAGEPSSGVAPPVDSGAGTVDPGPTDFFAPSDGGSFGIPDTPVTPDFGTAVVPEPAAPEAAPDADVDDFALDPIAADPDPPPPWVRLVVLVPLSVAIGVGGARLRRALEERALVGGFP